MKVRNPECKDKPKKGMMNSEVWQIDRNRIIDYTYEWAYGSPQQLDRLETLERAIDRNGLLIEV
ncbi:MAG: hypothetical protein Aureis2KO_27520 [Aureisphaera sp.]